MSKRLFALLFSGLLTVTMVMTPMAQAATVEIQQNEMEITENEIKEVETTENEISENETTENGSSENEIVEDNPTQSETIESSNLEEENRKEITEKIETTDKAEITDKTGTTEIDGLLPEVEEEQDEIQTDLGVEQQEGDLQSTVSTEVQESSTIEINREDTDRDIISSKIIAEGSCGENLRWTLTNAGELWINGRGIMNGYSGDGKGNYKTPWYSYREQIKKLYLEDGVETIGFQAFAKCSNLEEVVISDSVTKIGERAFYKCTSLKEVSIPASVIDIDYEVFAECNSLSKVSVLNEYCRINESPYTLGNTAVIYGYSNSTAQTYVGYCNKTWEVEKTFKILDLQPSTYIISYDANGGKNAPKPQKKDKDTPLILSDIEPTREGYIFLGWSLDGELGDEGEVAYEAGGIFKENINAILYAIWQADGAVASGSCGKNLRWNLTSNKELHISGTGAMDDYSENQSPWQRYEDNIGKIYLDGQITSIGSYAFYHCGYQRGVRGLEVEIPNTVTKIAKGAFSCCTNLLEINIPDSVTEIGEEAFYECMSLQEMNLPDSVTKIGEAAFSRCTSLRKINISNGVTAISDRAFYHCISLSEIEFPNSIQKIGKDAFFECESLKEINIPDSVTSIGDNSFSYCSNLSKIELPETVINIGGSAFSQCSSLSEINIPETVTSIGGHAFAGCSSLREITIPSGVTRLEDFTFDDCTSLVKIAIPTTIVNIGAGVFLDCTNLTEITIPNGVTRLGNTDNASMASWGVFEGCTSLKKISIPETVISIGDSAFHGCISLKEIKILNKDCNIYDRDDTIYNKAIIYGYNNSTAQKYAKKYNRTFKSLGTQPTTYTITYNANGGKNAPSAQKKTKNKTLTLSKTKPTRKGYTFLGWATSKNSTKVSYKPGASFKSDKNTTLYAVWQANSYKVAFNKNGGTGSMSTVSCVYDKTFTLKANTFKKKGYTFKGWNTKPDGTGTYSYADKAKVKNVSSVAGKTITLFAQWQPNSYKVAFNKNGGTGSMSTVSCVYDKTFTLKANTFKKKGYTFKGWNTKPDGTGTYSYADKAKVKNVSSVAGKTITLFAQWEPIQYTLHYDGNGATSGSMKDTNNCQYDKSYTLRKNTFKREGYIFVGWAKSAKGALRYKDAEKVKNISSVNRKTVTLYAVWQETEL